VAEETTADLIDVEPHVTETSLIGMVPNEPEAGIALAIAVGVSCASGCDLTGGTVRLVAEDGSVLEEVELAGFDGTLSQAVATGIKAPAAPGHYTWEAVFPAQTLHGSLHEESRATFSFEAKRHSTGMAVWDVPTPTAAGIGFSAKVGVQCVLHGCDLTGAEVEVYDQLGARIGSGTLADTPWPSTDTLYWAEVSLQAPATKGYYEWIAKFPASESPVPHEACMHTFPFTTGAAPEHVVTVEVTRKDTAEAVPEADITVMEEGGFPYRERSDNTGTASLHVPKGEYILYVVRDEYAPFEIEVSVHDDALVKAEMLHAPDPLLGER
jgi:hypothetical protein